MGMVGGQEGSGREPEGIGVIGSEVTEDGGVGWGRHCKKKMQ